MLMRGNIEETLGSLGCIAFILGEQLEVGLLEAIPNHGMFVGSTRFSPFHPNEFLGFFDWLRNPTELLCAVRLWPSDEFSFLSELVASRSYVVVDGGSVTIAFHENAVVDEQMTEHQAFGNTMLLLDENGMAAITFGLHFLEEPDVESILDSGIKLVEISVLGMA